MSHETTNIDPRCTAQRPRVVYDRKHAAKEREISGYTQRVFGTATPAT